MYSLESLYVVMILMNVIVGVLLLVFFKGKEDLSSRLWAYASFSFSIGLGVILGGQWLPSFVRYVIGNFTTILPFFLYVKSVKCLSDRDSGRLWIGGLLSLFFSLSVWVLVITNNSWFVPVFASLGFSFVYFWSAYELYRNFQKVKNSYIKLFFYLMILGGFAWVIRALLSKSFNFQFAPDPVFANWLILIVITLVVLLRQIAYLLIRFGSAEKESEIIWALNDQLTHTIDQKNALIKTLSTSVKANQVGGAVASIVHELSQPLGAIGLNTQLLLRSINTTPDPTSQTVILNHILQDNRRAANIISRLRNFYQKGPVDYGRIDISALVPRVLDLVAPMCIQNDIRMETRIESNLMVWGDAGELEMVVVNVLSNAINALATRTGSRVIRTTLRQSGDQVIVDIQDNGPGIPEDRHTDIFNLFHTSKSQGLGVGLWLSRAIMENHSGQINLVTSTERGTLFSLRLPQWFPLVEQG